ncbi:cobyric acid synthase [Ruminiclostridium papyrosolvens]|uniref:Cobyric acid synthase n=1 Tax=Ruminiclostridium papyrosolvens C7 TaxID=1330534 RepID=U4QXR4_9FIRM|nr:cobyric acid synthase [Ruminiclostridium papyrosolvens]EPR09337.1 cobyric acid synthase [Ruminiclostridium papyrosolvens C7]
MAKPIMIQGTMSNAGKSLLTAGLCRIFAQDGYRVAPFKSQNMALNSYITADGSEMGRAQVVQAEAAGKAPDVRMNPILLKPTSEKGSQVILEGQPIGNMTATEYYAYKHNLLPHINRAYESLSEENDIIVIEGAGSPAEINLKRDDFVNMGLAKMLKAPVLIAGDIDRGGVFASLYGTVMLFDEDERKHVKGTIINKFRGDVEILKPGLDMLCELIHVPVVGVVPYLQVDIDDEDSLTERFSKQGSSLGLIDIAVIKLPRISNFTDFNALEHIEYASVRYVSGVNELKNPDLIIIPGSKNTMGDLKWMRENGLEACILKHAAENKPVFGVCGGYQMLCETLKDPYGVEHGGEMKGMGLLKSGTVFEKEKTRTRVTGAFSKVGGIFKGLSGKIFEGYEIHMGYTASEAGNEGGSSLSNLTEINGNEKPDGMQNGNIYGTYVHGVFDSEEILSEIAAALMKEKGLEYEKHTSFNLKEYKEKQYDLLADALRESLDLEYIYKVIEEGI